MKTHNLKISDKYYDAVVCRIKNAEVRYNDRDYSVGDLLVLNEWNGVGYTGKYVIRVVKYMVNLSEVGLENWVLLCME